MGAPVQGLGFTGHRGRATMGHTRAGGRPPLVAGPLGAFSWKTPSPRRMESATSSHLLRPTSLFMLRTKINGLGMAVPPRCVSNDDLAEVMETSDEWIRQRTGIKQRFWAERDETLCTSDLAATAGAEALADAGLTPQDVDLIVFATLSPDASFPGSGCFLQEKLDIPAGVPAIDIRQQCTGFIYGLSIADLYVRAGIYRNVLLVGAEMQSKCVELNDRGRYMAVLFGDGAGAVVLSATEVRDPDARTSTESCFYSAHLHADGRHAKDLLWAAPGTANRVWNPPELAEDARAFPQMNGRLVFAHAVRRMPEVAREALEANGVEAEDVDLFVNHQANARINEKFADAMGVPPEKVFDTVDRYSNTTAATIPIGLYEARRSGRLEKGQLVAMASFGSGFTWASALLRW